MDPDLLREVYKRYYRKLFCYALSLCHNKADAEDLVSDTFVKAFLAYQGNGSLEAWLYRVLKNMFVDETRRQKHITEMDSKYIESIASMQSNDADESEKKKWIYEKIMELNSPEKEIMFLTLTSGLKDQEIAEVVNMTVANLRVIRHRVKENLKEQARKDGF